jgi:hypothetical protein
MRYAYFITEVDIHLAIYPFWYIMSIFLKDRCPFWYIKYKIIIIINIRQLIHKLKLVEINLLKVDVAGIFRIVHARTICNFTCLANKIMFHIRKFSETQNNWKQRKQKIKCKKEIKPYTVFCHHFANFLFSQSLN